MNLLVIAFRLARFKRVEALSNAGSFKLISEDVILARYFEMYCGAIGVGWLGLDDVGRIASELIPLILLGGIELIVLVDIVGYGIETSLQTYTMRITSKTSVTKTRCFNILLG